MSLIPITKKQSILAILEDKKYTDGIMTKKWIFSTNYNENEVDILENEIGVSRELARLMNQRGLKSYEEAKTFFRPELNKLHDPFLMKDMDIAIERLERAIKDDEKILVYGDYDVDGTTAVALVYSFLQKIHKNIDYYIPDRYKEGYGVSTKGIDYAHEIGATLIITLDCGIKALNKIKYANEKNIDVIVGDHHTPGEELPPAFAVLDPKRKDCPYPFKELSGCGIGFKYMQALAMKRNMKVEILYSYLDLVTVSIASDIVPIVDENRILAFYGVKMLNESPRLGLETIIDVAKALDRELDISDCVFKLGPRINAAGRIKSGRDAVNLLISRDTQKASEMGKLLNEYNSERRRLDKEITEEALSIIDNSQELQKRKTTVLCRAHWHKGVIGIVASRLIEKYYRPTIILTESEGVLTGSARSVEDYNLYKAIEQCSDLLENFGGHKFAAGLSLKQENFEAFTQKFEQVVSETITDDLLTPKIYIDAKINFRDITPKFYRILKQFAPFGPGNMSPVFMTENVIDYGGSKIVGSSKEHMKLELIHEDTILHAIAFFQAYNYDIIKSNKPFRIAYAIEENEFRGTVSLQLSIKDIQPMETL